MRRRGIKGAEQLAAYALRGGDRGNPREADTVPDWQALAIARKELTILLAVSFVMTKYGLMREHWARHSRLVDDGVLGTDRPIGRHVDLGGCLALVDWDAKEIAEVLPLPGPAGFVQHNGQLFVALWRKNAILVLDRELRPVREFSHQYLNDPHTLRAAHDGLLVANTGLDGLLLLAPQGDLLWSWLAVDHGFTHDRLGNRRWIDLDADHRDRDYPTLLQTTHLNSALEDPNDRGLIYASLFHQGAIVRIDRRTGATMVVGAGLDHCHSIRSTDEGFVVCDTRGCRLVHYDREFRLRDVVAVEGSWLADAWPTQLGSFLVLDGGWQRIVEVSEHGEPVAEMRFDPDWKGFQLEPFHR
ncbi:MAG: hypothetical protein ACRDYX_19405 [Egibacteraceae bacterium]